MRIALDARGVAERLVHRQEAAVTIDQRKTDRKHVEQRLEVRRAARRLPIRRTAGMCRSRSAEPGCTGTWTARSATPASPSAGRWNSPSSPTCDQFGKARALFGRGQPEWRGRRTICWRPAPGPRCRPKLRARRTRVSRSPVTPEIPWTASASGSADGGLGIAPQQQVVAQARALHLHRRGAGKRRDARNAAGAVAPGHGDGRQQRLVRILDPPEA